MKQIKQKNTTKPPDTESFVASFQIVHCAENSLFWLNIDFWSTRVRANAIILRQPDGQGSLDLPQVIVSIFTKFVTQLGVRRTRLFSRVLCLSMVSVFFLPFLFCFVLFLSLSCYNVGVGFDYNC